MSVDDFAMSVGTPVCQRFPFKVRFNQLRFSASKDGEAQRPSLTDVSAFVHSGWSSAASSAVARVSQRLLQLATHLC